VDSLSPLTDPGLLAYAERCVALAAAEFDRSALPTRFVVVDGGSVPEFRKVGDGSLVVVQRGSNLWQSRFQLGHEITHWLLTPKDVPAIFHWTHEMLANEVSLRCLRSSGLAAAEEVAEQNETDFRRKADGVSLRKMLATPLVHPYHWVYGRAFVVGRQLQVAAGWKDVKRLALYFTDRGQPDLAAWLAALPAHSQKRVHAVLGTRTDFGA
jgi:hypothetical protein